MIEAMPGDIFRPGQVLNNTYEIEGVLGRGGTGEVYRARNQITGRVVAIKALSERFSGNDAYVGLMRREEQMRDILDDAVVRYTECSRTEAGHVILVMDFVDGPSLNELMLSRRMDARELMIVAHRVAEGLVAAHRHGIVHRDLSPDNVILRDGRPAQATIIDFGIAKDTTAGARTIVGNEFAGKYEYAAPEQLEGRAEPRSDFYALGALVLAAFRGAVPFEGATPGEIVRRKGRPLDTAGVPEPLKALIDWLAAPDPAARPQAAGEVVARIDAFLRPTRNERAAARPVRAGGRLWLAVPVAVVVAATGLWLAFAPGSPFAPRLAIADPYRFTAAAAPDGVAQLSGNAPDAETAQRLVAAYGAAAGAATDPSALTLAAGMPGEDWPGAVAEALDLMVGLQDWRLDLSGKTARIEGLAADGPAREAVEAALDGWADGHGIALSRQIAAGPRLLAPEALAPILAAVADCGPLALDRPTDGSWRLGDTVTVSGAIETATTEGAIRARLEPAIGDRGLAIDTTALNPDLCAVRRVLPVLPSSDLSVWLGDGATGQANLSGIFHVGENPIVEIHAPAGLADASLWVVLVDNTGKVFNLLPNINAEAQDMAALGWIENGVRRIRVLHSIDELRADGKLLAMRISDGDFGKSEIIAILSRRNLFDIRRPRDESVASFAEALAAIQTEAPGNILAVASRLLDSRP